MTAAEAPPARTVRRARPMLGTLVEVGAWVDDDDAAADALVAFDAAFARIAALEARLSRFVATSDVGRFDAARAGATLTVGDDARHVLAAARRLCDETGGAFDATLGTGPDAWSIDGATLHKHRGDVRLDLGGIAKGHAVDAAVQTLRGAGVADGWVNAGGDLRAFGRRAVALDVRDESRGGVHRFGSLVDGAFATSRLAGRHASVAAPCALDADALTKVVVATGDVRHPAVVARGATAWLHAA